MQSISRRSVLQSGAAVAAGFAVAGASEAQAQDLTFTEKTDADFDFSKAKPSSSCRLLARTVAKTKAQATVVPGIVNNTFFLFVAGKKPYINMTVQLVPAIYIRQPEYWRIEVVGCLSGIPLPMIGPYFERLSLDACRGTKGIEVVWDDDAMKIDV